MIIDSVHARWYVCGRSCDVAPGHCSQFSSAFGSSRVVNSQAMTLLGRKHNLRLSGIKLRTHMYVIRLSASFHQDVHKKVEK